MDYKLLQFLVDYIEAKGFVAQWLEQGTHKPKVAGSSPAKAKVKIINGEMAEWSKAADC